MTIAINAAFDGGNIRVVAIDGEGDDWRCDLEIVRDHQSDFFQWFYFRAAGLRGRRVTFRILNAGESAYPFGWPGYRTRASTDLDAWRMIETRYDGGVLAFDWTGEHDLAWFAYFAPYTMEMHARLVARIAAHPGVTHRELGTTLDGQAIDYFRVGTGAKQVWLYARQHPGESMAEWWMEGALEVLADPADSVGRELRKRCRFHVVPNLNPDGSARGHLRTNAAGVNLNREWAAPSAEKSPEVLAILDAMDETGVDFAMDIHGDEAIPAVFLAGFEGIPSLKPEQKAGYDSYAAILDRRTPDFQRKLGYSLSQPGKGNLTMSTNQLAERYGAVSMTLEMPFKDHDDAADPRQGWSPERSAQLGKDCMGALLEWFVEQEKK